MKYYYLLLGLLLLAGCEPKPEDEFTDFIFQLPFQMTARDTISIGDTLWLTADISDQLREFNSGSTYKVTPRDFEFKTLLGLRELTFPDKDLADQPSATESFLFVDKTGSLTRRGTTFSPVNYAYANEGYKLRIGLVPRQQGVFCLNFLNGWGGSSAKPTPTPDLSYLLTNPAPNGGRRIGFLDGFYHYINEGNTNFYLFKQHCFATSLKNNPSVGNVNYEQEATFTFVVK
ncbi:hypothetical protein [Hymenobacter lapidiphilus]|uniref:Uncharacterized protein n=1 Tax=Hymenobacter lapidiphilus TaxID=2608003 RepID=A0A7Y7PR19_9BACT|nr:hypothetical protein [Hymenobacter lapidiphilus]NVO32471.1 hypothetical protein [Hymenobacter lapidiphilus]